MKTDDQCTSLKRKRKSHTSSREGLGTATASRKLSLSTKKATQRLAMYTSRYGQRKSSNSGRKMKISEKGKLFIKNEEGCVLKTYKDQVGVLTIGVGHTGSDVVPGKAITLEEAMRILESDLRWVMDTISQTVKVALTQNQYDALCSMIFNIGPVNFKKSTTLVRLNAGDYAGAAEAMLNWNKGGKPLVVLPVLVARRKREHDLFLSKET